MKLTKGYLILFLGLLFALSGTLAASSRQTPKPPSPPDYSKEPFVIEKVSTEATFESDGTYSVKATARVRIQSQAGVQQFGLLNFPYASATSTVAIVYVRVVKPDGRVVQTPPENILDMPADITRQAPFYSDLKVEQVAVKGLEIGDVLEYQSQTQVQHPLVPGQFWYAYNFTHDQIALEENLRIGVPANRYVNVKSAATPPALSQEGSYRIYTWKTANLARKAENKQPDETPLPSVQLTTFRSWDEVGQWFRSLALPRAAVTPEIQSKANELTRGAHNDSEKIQSIYNFVSTNFRYIGISLGIGRYQPHAATDVLANGYGDCKDKHTLFVALLSAAGVKAYPALINSSAKIDPDVPSPLQFDHVITALPQEKGFLFLDTTPGVAPFGLLVATLRGKDALVIPDTASAQLVQTPPDPPFKSFDNFQADGALDNDGTLNSKMQMTLRGDAELVYRLVLRQAGQSQWNEVMQQISANLGFGGTVSDVTATSPDATDMPFHIEYSYNRKDYSDWSNKRITPPFPPFFLQTLPDNPDKYPKQIKLGSPVETVYEATLKLPSNSDPQLPSPVDLNESFAEYHAVYSFSAGTLHVERRLVTKAPVIPPDKFEAYRKFRKAILDDANGYISLSGAPSASAETSGSAEAQSLNEQGDQAYKAQNIQAALDAYQRAVEKDPKFAQGWFSLGWTHLILGDLNQGVEEIKKAMTLDPSQVSQYKSAASILMTHQQQAAQAALSISIGSILMSTLQQQAALEIWKDIEKTAPKDPDPPRYAASILSQEKNYSAAIAELEPAVARMPDNATLLLSLGEDYLRAGDTQKGVSALQGAVKMDQTPFTLNDASYSLADNNLDLDDALKYGEEAVNETENDAGKTSLNDLTLKDIQIVPRLAMYWDTLGWAHFRMGHLDLAERYLNAGWSLAQDPVIADHLGQLYEKQGKTHEAALAYSHALSSPNPPEHARDRLNALRPDGKYQPGEGSNPEALQQLRTVKLGRLASQHASAEFFVLFTPDSKTAGATFVTGSDQLRDAAKTIEAAKFDVLFPDNGPEQILRRGVVDCEPELPGCIFVLIPPSAVHSVK